MPDTPEFDERKYPALTVQLFWWERPLKHDMIAAYIAKYHPGSPNAWCGRTAQVEQRARRELAELLEKLRSQA